MLVLCMLMLMFSGDAFSEVSTEASVEVVFPAAMTSSTKEPCDVVACLIECADGFEIDERGCQACRCRLATVAPDDDDDDDVVTACPPIDCPPCPSDRRAVDTKGCSTCECVQLGYSDEPTTTVCTGLMTCRLYCPYGNEKDSDGCDICRCVEVPTSAAVTCSPLPAGVRCAMDCQFGFARDADGCHVCQCQGDPCEKFTCESNEKCIRKQLDEGDFVARCIAEDHHPCEALDCHLECRGDFTLVDESGCKVCRCKSRTTTTGPPYSPSCPLHECPPCPDNEYEKYDENGCKTCTCACVAPDEGKAICPELSVACRINCPDGLLRKDADGCPVCECLETEQKQLRTECPQLTSCRMRCPYGQEKDSGGCDVCRCRNGTSSKADCPSIEANCSARCRLGRAKDVNGCEICECQEDFCENLFCSEEETCAAGTNDEGELVAECIPGRRWCSHEACPTPCEHGFMHDQRGCPLCSCLGRRLDGCRDIGWCSMVCEFGHQRNEHGCRICECLPNPCQQNRSCSAGEVCEVFRFRNCINCPAATTCIASSDVRRLYVVFTYEHSFVRNLDIEKFRTQVTESVSRLLDSNGTSVFNVSVTPLTRLKTKAAFHILGPSLDLVAVATDLLSTLRDARRALVTFELNRVTFAPVQDTAVVMYHSNEEVEEDLALADVDQSLRDDRSVAASCIVGIVFVAVCSVVMFVVLRKSRQQKPNIIYKRVIVG